MSKKLTTFLRDMLNEKWSTFVAMEADETHTSSEGVVFSLVRACQKGNLQAIKEALDRIDGKVAIEIEIDYPKFYFLYPYATSAHELPAGEASEEETPPPTPAQAAEQDEKGKHSLNYLLAKMSDQPRALVTIVLEAAKQVDLAASYKGQVPEQDPLVKSVIIAGLLQLAHKGQMSAAFEVLDQLDGKVAEKIKPLGTDVYIRKPDTIAPAGAVKNEDGVYQIVAENTTSAWAIQLAQLSNKGR